MDGFVHFAIQQIRLRKGVRASDLRPHYAMLMQLVFGTTATPAYKPPTQNEGTVFLNASGWWDASVERFIQRGSFNL
jgi:hypothetical protein